MDPPSDKDSIGHFGLVTLNLRDESFQYIDSLYTSKQTGGWRIFNRMVKNIKELWDDACQDMTDPLSRVSSDTKRVQAIQVHHKNISSTNYN